MMKKTIHNMVVWIISGLMLAFRSLLGPASCRYEVGCTKFALMQLQEQPLCRACIQIGKRLLSCNPIFSSDFACKESAK